MMLMRNSGSLELLAWCWREQLLIDADEALTIIMSEFIADEEAFFLGIETNIVQDSG